MEKGGYISYQLLGGSMGHKCFFHFVLFKFQKVANNSTTTETCEELSTDLESL
jgi:hypothetical protein